MLVGSQDLCGPWGTWSVWRSPETSLLPLPRPPQWVTETLGVLCLGSSEGPWLSTSSLNQLPLGMGAWPAPSCLLGWGALPAPPGQWGQAGQAGLTACSVARSPCRTRPQEQR